MIFENDKISLRQFQILMILDAFGTGVIVLPRRTAEYAAQDGWLIVIGLIGLGLLSAVLITTIARMFPSDSFIAYTSRILSKPVSLILGLSLFVKILFGISLELRLFAEILRDIMLPKTPLIVTSAVMLAVGAYTASKGIETRARIGEILFFIMIVPLLALFILTLTDIDLTNLLPVFNAAPTDVLTGTLGLGFILTGLESCLLVFPYLQRPKEGRKAVSLAVVLTGFVVLLITLTTIARFGPYDVLMQKWPVLKMMDMIKIPGSFIERQDALIMSFWIISVFAAVNASLFYGAILLRDITVNIHKTPVPLFVYVLFCVPVIFILSLLPKRVDDIFWLFDRLYGTFGIAFLFIIPLVLLIIAKLRRLGGRYDA